jgi:hypothetical protein
MKIFPNERSFRRCGMHLLLRRINLEICLKNSSFYSISCLFFFVSISLVARNSTINKNKWNDRDLNFGSDSCIYNIISYQLNYAHETSTLTLYSHKNYFKIKYNKIKIMLLFFKQIIRTL